MLNLLPFVDFHVRTGFIAQADKADPTLFRAWNSINSYVPLNSAHLSPIELNSACNQKEIERKKSRIKTALGPDISDRLWVLAVY